MNKATYDADAIEKKWREIWEGQDLYSWDAARPKDETFAIDSPPPTVSGSLHLGHVFSYTHQDLVARYKRMKGLNVCYPMGWDDNGLPTERRVQNFYNVRCDPKLPYDPDFQPRMKAKEHPEVISRLNFIKLCEERTKADETTFKDLWQKLALSIDWSFEYSTISEHCRRVNQQSFINLCKKGEVYQTEAPVMWDVDFGTAIAQAEIEERELPSEFVTLRFGVKEGGELLVATTRPELLGACVAVLVHPDDVRNQGLIGKTAVTPLFSAPVPIMADKLVDPAKGTGCVMVCTFGDATDVEWWRELKLPLRRILDDRGCLLPIEFGTPGWDSLDPAAANAAWAGIAGAYVAKARKVIVGMLREAGIVTESKPITHAVKFFEKGERPLEIIPTRQWFVRLLDHKQELIAAGETVNWTPSFMFSRYRNWVENLSQDWCISRQRFFGVPFPVWYRLDEEGNTLYDTPLLPDAARLPVDPLIDAPEGFAEAQRDQPNGFTGSLDVQDTWSTSALTPLIISQWDFNPERHGKLFPMGMRPQGHDIIRTWAFYTITMAWLHQKSKPWDDIVISGWVLDFQGKKMSKSKGNVVTPEGLFASYPSDAIRYWAARAHAGVDTALDESVFKVGKRLITKLFNAARFVYTRLGDAALPGPQAITAEIDRALVERLAALVEQAGERFEKYEWAHALAATESFFWADFCDDYLELVKARAKVDESGAVGPDAASALATLELALNVLLRLFAPVMPTITEELWHQRFAKSDEASIHSRPWPARQDFAQTTAPQFATSFDTAKNLLTAIRQARAKAQLSRVHPVAELTITCPSPDVARIEAVVGDVCAVEYVQKLVIRDGDGATEIGVAVEFAPAPADTAH